MGRASVRDVKEVMASFKNVKELMDTEIHIKCSLTRHLRDISFYSNDVKRPNPIYLIKTGWELSRRENLKAHLKKLRCLVKDSLHSGPSRISSPLASYPTAYGKFVMDNTKYIFIHGFPSFHIPYFLNR